jgi:uncharacterized protein (TIGR00369 family)
MAVAISAGQLEEVLARAAFARVYDFRLHSFGDGECVIEVPFKEQLERPGGIVAGTAYMTAADVVFWLAIVTRLGVDAESSVTVNMSTAFLSSARREAFRATGRVLREGRNLVYGIAECATVDGRLLSHHTLTYTRGRTPA